MPVDGRIREYTWDDIVRLIYADAGVGIIDKQNRTLTYLGAFVIPIDAEETCIRITEYK